MKFDIVGFKYIKGKLKYVADALSRGVERLATSKGKKKRER